MGLRGTPNNSVLLNGKWKVHRVFGLFIVWTVAQQVDRLAVAESIWLSHNVARIDDF